MLWTKRRLKRTPVFIFAVMVILAWGCGGEDERPVRRGAEQSTLEAGAAGEAGVPADLEDKRSPEELRQEIDALFAKLQRMHSDLQRRETDLEMRSRRIRAREVELADLERRVRRLQRTAYGLLAVGLTMLVLGLVALVRSRRHEHFSASAAMPARRPPAPKKSAPPKPAGTEDAPGGESRPEGQGPAQQEGKDS